MSGCGFLLQFFRLFFPSWKFFDSVGSLPKLYFQIESRQWEPLLHSPPIVWWNLFVNSEGNLHHAYQNLVNRLVLDLNQLSSNSPDELTSFQLVEQLVRSQIHQLNRYEKGQIYRFKISVTYPHASDVLISSERIL